MKIKISDHMPIFRKIWKKYLNSNLCLVENHFIFEEWVRLNTNCYIGGVNSGYDDGYFIFESELEYHQFLLEWS